MTLKLQYVITIILIYKLNIYSRILGFKGRFVVGYSDGVQNLVIELDAKVVVELVQFYSPSSAFYSSLLADCRSLLGKFQHYRVQHAFREVNRVADAMAKLGGVMQDHFVFWDNPPSDVILAFVYSDTIGEIVCRLAASNLTILA